MHELPGPDDPFIYAMSLTKGVKTLFGAHRPPRFHWSVSTGEIREGTQDLYVPEIVEVCAGKQTARNRLAQLQQQNPKGTSRHEVVYLFYDTEYVPVKTNIVDIHGVTDSWSHP